MSRIMIIQGHPDSEQQHLCHALASAYAIGAEQAGHEVRTLDVATIDFPLLRNYDQWYSEIPAQLQESKLALEWADHLLIVYPLWLGTMPAMLKAYIEQLFRPGIALQDAKDKDSWPQKLLRGKSCRIVVTMGMPAFYYRWFYLAHSLKSLERNILKFCGISPVKESIFGLVQAADSNKKEQWMQNMSELGARAS